MKRIDLIIDALETGLKLTDGFISEWNQINKALAAAKELRNLKPVVWCSMSSVADIQYIHYFDGKPMIMVGGVGNEHHKTPLYALNNEAKND